MLLKEFDDTLYPYEGYSQIRVTVRGLVFNDKNEMAMMHIEGEDFFGVRNHYETPGGGVEWHESRIDTLKREVMEELGYTCEIEQYIGMVIDHYNLLNRISVHHFYVCHVLDKEKTAWTDAEKIMFKGVVWKTPEAWLEILNQPVEMVNELVHARERFIVKAYLNQQETLQD